MTNELARAATDAGTKLTSGIEPEFQRSKERERERESVLPEIYMMLNQYPANSPHKLYGGEGGRMSQWERAGIYPLTVWYIQYSLWSRRLCSNVPRLRLVNMVVGQILGV